MDRSINLYHGIFADVYHLYWSEYIDIIGPQLVKFIDDLLGSELEVLDLCCGTGRLSRKLLMEGYTVHGLDISSDMIRVARDNNSEFIKSGKANFYVDNVISFKTATKYDLIISTFDSLNHLNDLPELTRAFKQAYDALKQNGVFIFDLNTAKGLKKWDFIDVEDNENTVFIMHGGYDKSEKKAYTRVYGFHHLGENKWSKFDQLFTNQVFQMEDVYRGLEHVGFGMIEFRSHEDLETLVPRPEEEDRVIIIARK